MDSHLLFELTYMFYKVCSGIIHGERWLVEPSRKFCLFYPPRKGWLRNLAQRLFHNVSPYFFARRATTFPSMKAFLLTGERFAWWSSWPLSVHNVLFIIGRDIRAGRGSPLLCSTELLLQVINLSLHDFIIISLMGDVTFPSKTASTCVDGMYIAFLIVFRYLFYVQGWGNHPVDEHSQIPPDADLLDVDLILPYCPLYFTNAQVLPTDNVNCRDTICSPNPNCIGSLA